MKKEKYQKLVQRMVESGEITQFKELFEYVNISHVIDLLATNHKTVTRYIMRPNIMRVEVVLSIADFLEIDHLKFFGLVDRQIEAAKKSKKSRP